MGGDLKVTRSLVGDRGDAQPLNLHLNKHTQHMW
jgi:hypothetical protein